MIILGLETSSDVCSVGLTIGDAAIERTITENRIHSEKLMSLVDAVVSESGRTLSAIDGVAVSRGPGSFTGLRIGVSAAKGLCVGLNKPIVGVSTFAAVVRSCRARKVTGRILVCVDAKQGDWYVGLYDGDDTELFLGVESISTIWAWAAPGCTLATDKTAAFVGMETDFLDIRSTFSGGTVAECGRQLLTAGRSDDVVSVEPMYLKDFVIRHPRQSAAGRTAV